MDEPLQVTLTIIFLQEVSHNENLRSEAKLSFYICKTRELKRLNDLPSHTSTLRLAALGSFLLKWLHKLIKSYSYFTHSFVLIIK